MSLEIQFSAKNENGDAVVIERTMAENLTELIEKYGEECVASHALVGMKNQLRAAMASELRDNKNADLHAVYEKYMNAEPSVVGRRATKDPVDEAVSLIDKFKSLSPEQQKRAIEKNPALAALVQ